MGTTTIDTPSPIWNIRDCDTLAHNQHMPNSEHQGLWHSVDYCAPVCRKCTKSVADTRCWNLKCVQHTVSFKTSYFTSITLVLQVLTHHTINNLRNCKFQHWSRCWWCEIRPSKGLGLPLLKFNPMCLVSIPWVFFWVSCKRQCNGAILVSSCES